MRIDILGRALLRYGLAALLLMSGALAPDSPLGGFLMKDIVLLGAALYTAAEALEDR